MKVIRRGYMWRWACDDCAGRGTWRGSKGSAEAESSEHDCEAYVAPFKTDDPERKLPRVKGRPRNRNEKVYTVQEVMAKLGCSRMTVYRKLERGELDRVTVGRHQLLVFVGGDPR